MSVPDKAPESLLGQRVNSFHVSDRKRKQLGQCFTGLRTGNVLAALSVGKGQSRIIDPMAGHGDLIESAAWRANRLEVEVEQLSAVEIEPKAARICRQRMERCVQEYGFGNSLLVRGDAFATETWKGVAGFDLVITNPPYVRYQTLSNRSRSGAGKLRDATQTRKALLYLAQQLAPPTEQAIWQHLILSYSGLADLSLPSWFLCGLITAPGGILALVVPQTWLNRDYARIARYFFLRFFQPIVVVQESGNRWFRSTQVPVALVVGRRLMARAAATPLLDRTRPQEDINFVEIERSAASKRSHVGTSFPGEDPEGEFARWLRLGMGSRQGVHVHRVPWSLHRNEVTEASRDTTWLPQMEDCSSRIAVSDCSAVLPATTAGQLPSDFLQNTRALNSGSIRIGQGLRTGCNAFFYVDVLGPAEGGGVSVVTNEIFGKRCLKVPHNMLRPVLRRQSELASWEVRPEGLRGRLLDLRNVFLPTSTPKALVSERGGTAMPRALAQHVRLAARTFVVRSGTNTLIPDLSAVRPNGRGPKETAEARECNGERLRMWYMVPDLAPRHLPAIFIPRVVHDVPRAFMNSKPRVLVDANFSTVWLEGDEWSVEGLFSILNSSWGELCMEALGATLGGGALKVEATHLRRLPVPILSSEAKEKLTSLTRGFLAAKHLGDEFENYRRRVDQILISALTSKSCTLPTTESIARRLMELSRSLRSKRRPSKASEKTEA